MCNIEFPHFGASYPDAHCIDGYLWDMDSYLEYVKMLKSKYKHKDSLPEEKPSEDLEEAASRGGFDYVDEIEAKAPGLPWNDHDVEFGYRDGFIAGAEWQRKQLLKGSPLPEDTVLFQKGVEEGKRLMMEEAVDGVVCYGSKGAYVESDWLGTTDVEVYGDSGDKVKIIIVKK